jgi:hypothetical protein
MELERIAWGALGVVSFIVLIAWLHWEGPWEDKKDEPPQELKEREHQAENSRSIVDDYLTLN